MANVLVIYYANDYPLRAAIRDHLYCFPRTGDHRWIYLNLAVRAMPRDLERMGIDLVIFHTLFLSTRWDPPRFRALLARAEPLRHLEAVKAILPQDEFYRSRDLNEFIRWFGVSHVFTVAPESQWNAIYNEVDRAAVALVPVLTGYLDDRMVRRFSADDDDERSRRPIDVGYRAWRVPPWLGRAGRLKVDVAHHLQSLSEAAGWCADISVREEDTILGDAWYRFLLRCRYTIGVEGGASILDRDGVYRERTEAYLAAHPGAGFEEVERECFPGAEGSLDLLAISPRHLEACVTRTCQVLVEGAYGGILEPMKHYIPIARDFGNLDEVLARMEDEDLRRALTERAYRDVVASGRYRFPALADLVVRTCLGESAGAPAVRAVRTRSWRAAWCGLLDRPSWALVVVRRHLVGLLKRTGVFPVFRRALRRLT